MAETIPSAALDYLLRKITLAIENEASLIGGLGDELDAIKRKFITMRYVLQDADENGVLTRVDKDWVDKVRDISHEVEDVIDEFMYHMNMERNNGGKCTRLLYHTVLLPKSWLVRHRVATKLQKINRKITEIDETRRNFAIDGREVNQHVDYERLRQHDAESSVFIKDRLVGIERDENHLVELLIDQEVLQRIVISVVGMGGSGNTTLVSKAYNNLTVRQHFHCFAWITVSQTYDVLDLMRRMIKDFYSATKEAVPIDLNTMKLIDLISTMVNYLQTKRYIVVLDDVWSSQFWDEIRVSLPDDGSRSRVMLTTRDNNIAKSLCSRRHIHEVRPMRENEAWELFCMKAFANNDDKICPEELLRILCLNLRPSICASIDPQLQELV